MLGMQYERWYLLVELKLQNYSALADQLVDISVHSLITDILRLFPIEAEEIKQYVMFIIMTIVQVSTLVICNDERWHRTILMSADHAKLFIRFLDKASLTQRE